jgi:Uma2 family endonuclease
MATATRLYGDYLRALEQSSIKLEYCDGVISAMAGGTIAHAALGANVTSVLKGALRGCQVFSSDLKVRVEASDLSTFPDVSAVCGPIQASPVDAHALTNPTILVEVTSRSTEDYDRGDKLSHYKQLGSLRAVLFVSHRTASVTVVSRTKTGWEERVFRSGETLELTNPALSFPIDALYAGVTLDEK